jgi:DNA-binding transcriptional regulator YiaG
MRVIRRSNADQEPTTLAGRRLVALRRRLNLTQVQLARLMGCGGGVVGQWEQGFQMGDYYARILHELEEKVARGEVVCVVEGDS